MFNLNKFFGLALILCVLLIVVPSSFAYENSTDLTADNLDVTPLALTDENILQEGKDIYFNASAEKDGDGSLVNPYKYLKADRISANSNIYLAEGEYNLDTYKSLNSVNFIGMGAGKTIVCYYNYNHYPAFTVSGYMTLSNLTIDGANVQNNAQLNATNVVFSNCYGSKPDSYGNNYGGAIYCPSGNTQVNINNCSFHDNYAEYGGAIYMGSGNLNIINSMFINNYAYNFGGSIACQGASNILISKSKFYNSYSVADAGGVIYIKSSSSLTINDVEIANASATFGGAIVSLYTDVALSYLKICNSTANWDGGAIYHMYGGFSSTYGNFYNNSAKNGGALYIDNSTKLFLRNNNFESNRAGYCAGAIYSLCNTLESSYSVRQFNTFLNNAAVFRNDEYEQSSLNINIANGNYAMYKYNETYFEVLPSNYSLRDNNFTTIAKDQQSGGNCWAFASLAALESAILKASGTSLDLSEENMKNVIAKYSDYGWKIETNDGGYDNMLLGYLVSWLGPVLESDDSYDDKSVLSPVLDTIMHVQNIAFLKRDDNLDNDDIKRAVLKYGAVATPILYDNKYFKGNGYYCWNYDYANHLVAIVGWDDNYSRNNFYGIGSDEGDGAWIVKNSWGSGWGDNGYFYVSYHDKAFAQVNKGHLVFAFILNDTIRYEKNYQYDIAGMTDYFYTGDSELWYKNVFAAEGDEFIAGVSTYFEEITNWTASVFVNGDLQIVLQGISNPGYYTIDLGRLIPVHEDDVFEIVFRISVDGDAGIPISEYYSLNKEIYKPGISFISLDGQKWEDFYNKSGKYSTHTYFSQVACLKAFTIKNIINTTLSLIADDEFNIAAKVTDQYGNLLNNGNVTFEVNGLSYTLNITDGVAVLSNIVVNQNHNYIKGIFSDRGYNSSTGAVSVDIPKTNIDLSLNIFKFKNNAIIYLESSNNISTSMRVKVNNENYRITILKGKGYLNLTNLSNDFYSVGVICEELSTYQFDDLFESFVIDVKGTRIVSGNLITSEGSGALFNITLVDENDDVLPDKDLIITFNNMTFHNRTDSNGRVLIPINLTKGEYVIDIYFNGDENYFESNQSNIIKVKVDVDIGFGVDRTLNNVTVKVNLSKMIDESLTVIVNDKHYAVNSTEGNALLNLYDLPNGVYNVTVCLDDLEGYNCLPVSFNFTVDVKNTKIISSDLVMNDEEESCFNIILTDENGVVLPNKTIIFYLGGDIYTNLTDEDGIAHLHLDLNVGNYDLDIVFEADNDYFGCTGNYHINVRNKVGINVSVDVYQNTAVLSINMSKPINESLVVRLNSKDYEVNSINGNASLDLSDLSNGHYKVSVILNEEIYEFSHGISNFTIDVKNTLIISDDFVTYEKSGDLFNITLVDENNNILSDKELIIVLDNLTYAKTTDSNGAVSIPLSLKDGVYSIYIIFKGDKDHYASSQSSNIKVKMVVGIDVNVERSLNNAVVNVNLSRMINESLNVIVNDEIHEINSINGKASLDLSNLSNGVYEVRVSLDDDFKSDEVNSTFVIDVKKTQINSSDLLVSDDDEVKFNMTLTDENGVALANKTVTFVLDNISYYEVTDADGFASISVSLAHGKYDMIIGFDGDNDYFPSHAVNAINVRSRVDIDVLVEINQNNVLININLSKSINEDMTVIVNGKKYCISSDNGNASLCLSNLSNGVYNLSVSLDDVENYSYLEINSTFIIDVKTTKIQSADLIINENEDEMFSITLTDENGIVLANKTLTFVLDNVSYDQVTDVGGVAFIPVNLAGGKYDVFISFAGDDSHFASGATNIIRVKMNVAIDLMVTKSLNNATVNINLSKPINETLTVIVNDNYYKIKSNDGYALLKLSNLSNGKYAVAVCLDSDAYYSQEVNYEFIMNVKDNATAPDEVVIVDDESNQFNITIIDENNVVLINKEVSIVLDNVRYDVVSDDNGHVSMPLDLGLGEHTIDIYIRDDNNQTKSIKSDMFAVKTNVKMEYNIERSLDKTWINVNLSKMINGTLEIVVDNQSYKLAINSKTMSFELPDLEGDIHDVEIRLAESNMYEFNHVSAQINVSIKKTVILVDDFVTYHQSGKSFVATLVDEDGRLLSGQLLRFRFSNNLLVAKTNDAGRASINVSLIKGQYDVFVTFDGDNNHYNSSNSSKITVKSTILLTDSSNKTYGSDYSFILLDGHGSPLKNLAVAVGLGNVSYAIVSDAAGIVSLPITKEPGEYDVIINNPASGETLSKTIAVLGRITQNNDLTIYEYSGSRYNVLVLDNNGNPEVAGKTVTFKINGKTYSSKTDDKGYAGLKISLKSKDYTITVTYKGFKVSNKVKVKPVLTAKNVVKKKAKSYKFQAKLVNKNGKVLKGKKITFKIKGKKFTAKTNKKGVATVTIKLSLKVGAYKIYTSYGKSKITNTLKIKK